MADKTKQRHFPANMLRAQTAPEENGVFQAVISRQCLLIQASSGNQPLRFASVYRLGVNWEEGTKWMK
jgi:hypothetical protein